MSKASITVSWKDVASGRAYLRIPDEGRLDLFHWAGAPWSETKPKAFLSPIQVETLLRKERVKIVHGGSKLGKSVLGGCVGIETMMIPGHRLAIVAGNYRHVGYEAKYLQVGLQRLFKGKPGAFLRNRVISRGTYFEFSIEMCWASVMKGISVDFEEGSALLGDAFHTAVLGEGAHVSPDIFNKKLVRALDSTLAFGGETRRYGGISIFTTPHGFEGCSAAEWERVHQQTKGRPWLLHADKVPFASSIWIREAKVIENPAYDASVYEARKAAAQGDKRREIAFAEQQDGRMTFASGRVLHEFGRENIVPRPDTETLRNSRIGVGIDTGANMAMSLFAILPDGTGGVIGEVKTEQRVYSECCDEFKDVLLDVLGEAYRTDDPQRIIDLIDTWSIDPASQHKLEINEYLDVSVVGAHNPLGGKLELLPSLEEVNRLMADNLWFVTEDCEKTTRELDRYIWKIMKMGRGSAASPVIKEPRKQDDHCIDAMRLIGLIMFDLGPADETVAPLTMAEAWTNAQIESVSGPLRDIMRRAAETPGGMQC